MTARTPKPAPSLPVKERLTVDQAARVFGVTPAFYRKQMDAGVFPGRRAGTEVLIYRCWVDRWFVTEGRTVEGTAAEALARQEAAA